MSAEGSNNIPPTGTLNKIKRSAIEGGPFVSAEGVEPSTNSLKGYCSAIELRAHFLKRTAFYHVKIQTST